MRKVVLMSLLMPGVVAVIGAGAAQAKPDLSFGQSGVLPLAPPVPAGWNQQQVYDAATGGDGQVFVVDGQYRCDPGPANCVTRDFVFDYLADGSLNTAFGGPQGYEVPAFSSSGGAGPIAVTTSGLPVVAFVAPQLAPEPAGAIHLQRLLANGGLDPSFGLSGTTTLSCNCGYGGTRVLPGPENSTVVTVTEEVNTKSGAADAATLYKLNAAGLAATRYGSNGSAKVTMPGGGSLDYQALAPGGAAYFGGAGDSVGTYEGALVKVTASGKVDGRYTKAAAKSLDRLVTPSTREKMVVRAAVAAKSGEVTLFGTAGEKGGFELKLRPSGKLETKFGKQGLRRLNRQIVAAVGGSEGAAMTLAVGSSTRLLRLLADGRPDPKFGTSGEELPGLGGFGVSLSPAGKGKVDVIDLGLTSCRGICQVAPKVYRFLEH